HWKLLEVIRTFTPNHQWNGPVTQAEMRLLRKNVQCIDALNS
ncbi:16417_t:CDS:1, partial [Cetraspora pellucida]